MLTIPDVELLPTAEDVAHYQALGYWVSPPIFSASEIEDARFGCEAYWAGQRDFHLQDQLQPFEGWRPGDGDALRINDYVSLAKSELAALVRKPVVAAIAARLSGSGAIRLWHDQLIYKPPESASGTTAIGWHVDHAYWQTCSSDRMLTAWIPLTDCDEAMGTLMVIPGSHLWSPADLRGFQRRSIEPAETFAGPDGLVVSRTPIALRAGQVSFHHCRTIHGSAPNRSDRPRLSLSVHLQDGDNHYCHVTGPDGNVVWHRNDVLCRQVGGVPDYSDEDICPLLWSGGHPQESDKRRQP